MLGGTFDRLHVGHECLLRTAFALGGKVGVGLTTPAFLRAHRKERASALQSYAARRAALLRWIRNNAPRRPYWIGPLNDGWGRSVDPGVDVLVVSAETEDGARSVNRERRRRGLPPVRVVAVPLVLAEDLRPVSSRRIRAGIIDPQGRRTSPLRVGVSVPPPWTVAPIAAAIRSAFPSARHVVVVSAPPGRERTALRRAALAIRRADLGIGIVAQRRNGRVVGSTLAVVSPEVRIGPIRVGLLSPAPLPDALRRLLQPGI